MTRSRLTVFWCLIRRDIKYGNGLYSMSESPWMTRKFCQKKMTGGHANVIGIDKDSNYLVSFYDMNHIWKINSKSSELMWIFGKNGDFEMDTDDYFSGQHAVQINHEGTFMLFDNGINRYISRALSFTMDQQNKRVKKVIDATLEEEYYTGRSGSAYLLENGKILQCSSNREIVLLTDRTRKVLWYIRPLELTYRTEYVPASIFDVSVVHR